MEGLLIPAIGLLILLGIYLSVTVVRQDEAIVIFRMGRTSADMVRGPGLHVVIPIIDRAVRVRMTEVSTVATVDGTSKDDLAVSADLTIRWRVLDPLKSVVSVANAETALKGVAGAALEDIDADEGASYPGRAAEAIEVRLKDAGKQWGITITEVSVRRLTRTT